MDDDEDLEMLRLAALKSLKKENAPTTAPVGIKTVNKIHDNRVIPVVSHIRSGNDKYYVAPGAPELVQPNLIHHPVTYIESGYEKMDINDAYVPQRLNAIPPPSTASSQQQPLAPLIIPTAYPDFNAFAAVATDPITNVQLSPRSAAFVYENKQIIKRRQGIAPLSPPSPSANPFRMKSRSPEYRYRSRSPTPNRYHKKSRSPVYHPNHSPPHYRNRSLSRSPQRRHSPQLLVRSERRNRSSRSRSPIPRANFDANRSERRSPVPPNRRTNNSSPINRHGQQRQWRAHSPQQQQQYGGTHGRKSGSPRTDEPPTNARRQRRTRSPNASNANYRGPQENRKRTSSHSPNRKNARLMNANRGRRPTSPQSQQTHFNNLNGNKSNYSSGRNRHRRPGSPATQNRRSSNSPQNHYRRRSPMKSSPNENGDTSNRPYAKDEKDSKIASDQNERQAQVDGDRKPADNNDESNESNVKEKSEQQVEDELLASSDSDNSDNEESDGIDLFASEESESENEGRFKLSSSKNERKTTVPTLSFSELGKTTTAPADVLLRDLDEMQTDTMHSSQSSRRGGGGSGRRNDHPRNNRRSDTRKFNSRESRDSRSSNRDRNRDRDRGRRERESSKPKSDSANDKSDRKSTTLRSTFASTSESRTKSSNSGKFLGNSFECSSWMKRKILKS